MVHQTANMEDAKLKQTFHKLGCQPIDLISEVNFFPKAEDIYHFTKCQGSRLRSSITRSLDQPHEQHPRCVRRP